MIRKARLTDLNTIISITDACGMDMKERGIYQWNEHYPSKAVFRQDIENNTLYIMELQGRIIGCMMLSTFKDPVYNAIKWLTPDPNNLYIHRLAVNPSLQKQGHGKELMDFAEQTAAEKHYLSIRLDTFSQNPRNQKFYEARGFKRLGDVFFPNQSTHPFHCYEKILVPS